MKPKINRAADSAVSQGYDRCQTPAYALDPLLPYLPLHWIVWEPAAGEGNIVRTLRDKGYGVAASELQEGQDFFHYEPPMWQAIVTNPPYSIKYEWLAHCYALGMPFALLVPVETIGAKAAQRLMECHGAEILLLDKRVNFKMPNKGWEGSAAQFPVLWLCWKLLPAPIVYGRLTPRRDEQAVLFENDDEAQAEAAAPARQAA